MTDQKRKLRAWLIGGAAFAAAMCVSGCSSMRSLVGMDDGEHTAQPLYPSSSMPITSTASTDTQNAAVETSNDAANPAPAAQANRPASVGIGTMTPDQLVAMGNESSVAAPMTSAVASAESSKIVNMFGELDGQPMPDSSGGVSQVSLQQHTTLSEGRDSDVAIDPSGRWLAFVSTRHNTHPQIYLQRVEGTSVVELTSDSADYAFPTFSSDGKQIAFCSNRAGDWDIYVMDIDGRNTVQVTTGAAQDLHPSFSPDGKRLAFCSLSPRANQWELWTVNLQTSEKRMIGYGLFPSWSPAKQKDQIAFQRARQRGTRWFGLWTLDLVDGEARSVTEVASSSNAAIVSPSWSPDGKRLAFSTIVDPSSMNANAKSQGPQDIWVVNADGSNRQRMTDGGGASTTPAWASDNRIYFVSNRGGSECVWSAQAERGSAPAMATTDTREEGH